MTVEPEPLFLASYIRSVALLLATVVSSSMHAFQLIISNITSSHYSQVTVSSTADSLTPFIAFSKNTIVQSLSQHLL